MDRLLTFFIELGLLTAAIGTFALFLVLLITVVDDWRRLRVGVHADLTDMTGQPIPASRGSRDLEAALSALGFVRIGILGGRWPGHKRPWPIRVDRSPDGRVLAQIVGTTGSSRLIYESQFDDGFSLVTGYPGRFRYVDDRVDCADSMSSPAGALEGHLARLAAAEPDHGSALVIDDLAEFIRVSIESRATMGLGLRRALVRPRMRRSAVLGVVCLGILFVFTFQLLRVVEHGASATRSVTWAAIAMPGGQSQVVEAVISTSSQFVAVGEIGTGQAINGAAWTSTDGRSWRLVLDDPATSPGATAEPSGSVQIFAVASRDTGLIAVGIVSSDFGQRYDTRAWSSTDGAAWNRIDGLTGLDGTPFYLASDGSRLVATGQASPPPSAPRAEGSIGMIWTSTDGKVWQRATFPGADLLEEVVAGPAGFVALSIRDVLASAPSYSAMLHSTDGLTWSEAVFEGLDGPVRVDALNADDGGYVALGAGGETWRSDDGRAWRRLLDDRSMFAMSHVNDVAGAGPSIVAVGEVGAFIDPSPGAWLSQDGRRWASVAPPQSVASFRPFHVAVLADRVVMFGLGGGAVGVIDSP